jgi:hypothetical protein
VEFGDAHLATHPEAPRLCARAGKIDTCRTWSEYTLTHGREDDPDASVSIEACSPCLGILAGYAAANDSMGLVMVAGHPVYDGHTTLNGARP